MVILPCKISLKMLQNRKNGIAPPNGVQSKNRFHGWISRWILTYLDPKSVSIPQKLPILEPCNFSQLPSKHKILRLSKIGHFWVIETLFGSKWVRIQRLIQPWNRFFDWTPFEGVIPFFTFWSILRLILQGKMTILKNA